MKRILLIGLAVGCIHFLFVAMIEHISTGSQVATLYLGLFGHNGAELFQDLLIPVFAIIAHFNSESLFSWKPIDYTYCLLASSVVYEMLAVVMYVVWSKVKAKEIGESGTK